MVDGISILPKEPVVVKEKPSTVGLEAIRNKPAQQEMVKKDKATRLTTPYMTKYEKARVLGARALQIRYLASDPA